jgi:ribosomal protein L11 methyltransferase
MAEALLQSAGALSVTLQDAADAPVFEPAPGEAPLWPRLTVTGLFRGDADPLALLAAVHDGVPGAHWRMTFLVERSWECEWLRDCRPLRFGRRLVVAPTGMAAPAKAAVIRLDPGLAFGTGTHPTTALCLEWLDNLAAADGEIAAPLAGARVVDYGCGSGILAIGALRLGASEAVAVDRDPQALLATRANAELNGVAGRLSACTPEEWTAALGARKADILVANILAGPLQALLPMFASHLAPGGLIALSGILPGQEAPLAAAAETWIRFDPPVMKDGWLRLTGQRNDAS